MFATDTFIDTVQGSKKYFVSAFITDEKIRKPLNAFVDAQTAFTKQIFKSFTDISTHVTEEATNAVQKAAKAV
jgi:hypothetical protein